MTIVADGLTKRFGAACAVDRLSLAIAPGEIYGLIGPNGAGKTTTMRMLAGLMQPSSGRALICDADAVRQPERAKARLGFVSGSTGLYERLTARELLAYFGRLYGVGRELLARRTAELARELDMGHLLERRCGGLSTGERQRVSLARASIHDPQVMIFDEPTAGLDVLASRFVADFIRRARDRGRAVLFSTHYMTEAELLCDRIGLIYRGVLVAEDTAPAIKSIHGVDSLEEVFLAMQQRRVAAVGPAQVGVEQAQVAEQARPEEPPESER